MKTATTLVLLALLSACAAPRYQSVKRYETATATEPCLAACVKQEDACKAQCQSKREACIGGLGPEVDKRYEEALRRHEQALRDYSWDLERYRRELTLGYGWGPYWGGPWGYYGWFPPFPPAEPPVAPSREKVKERLAAARCDQDCGCRSGYDACYQTCGGKIIHETQCVANCPSPK